MKKQSKKVLGILKKKQSLYYLKNLIIKIARHSAFFTQKLNGIKNTSYGQFLELER